MDEGDRVVAEAKLAEQSNMPQHHLSAPSLALLAAGRHDSDTLAVLRDAERSRRLLALRLLLHQTRKLPSACGPLAPVDDAWNLLVRAQREAPQGVSEMLSHPQVGVWSAHTLRRLRDRAQDTAPLWFHVGQLHSMASAAAIRAGLAFRMTIPLRQGMATLPTIGWLQLPGHPEWGTAHAVSDSAGCRIETRADGGESSSEQQIPLSEWDSPRILRGGPDGTGLSVHMDDVGPYRGLETPTPAEPLAPSAARRWEMLLNEAWLLLSRDYEQWARELSAGLSVVVPAPAAFRFRPHSASVGDGFGEAIVSEPYDAAQLSVTLVHEFQHSKLNAINHLVPLAHEDAALDCYSPWRDDPRPTMGLFQGVFAFTAVAEFWARRRNRTTGREHELADFEFALLRLQINAALQDLACRSSLTEAGRRFVGDVQDRIEVWREVELHPNVLNAARIAALDHRLGWRVSHLRHDSTLIRQIASAWRQGRTAPKIRVAPEVRPSAKSPKLDVKAVLSKVLIADSTDFAAARTQLGTGANVVMDAGEADFALVAGNAVEARDLYVAELVSGSDRPGAWSGLGIALEDTAPGRAATALLRCPELVRAVHRELAAIGENPDLKDLAAWFDLLV